jgi:hypothetical protein
MDVPTSLGALATVSRAARQAWAAVGCPAMSPEEIMDAARQRIGPDHPSVLAIQDALDTVRAEVKGLRLARAGWRLLGIHGADLCYSLEVRLPHAVVWISVKPMWQWLRAIVAPLGDAGDLVDVAREVFDVNGVLRNEAFRRRAPRALALGAWRGGGNVIVADPDAVRAFATTAWAVLRAWIPDRVELPAVDVIVLS